MLNLIGSLTRNAIENSIRNKYNNNQKNNNPNSHRQSTNNYKKLCYGIGSFMLCVYIFSICGALLIVFGSQPSYSDSNGFYTPVISILDFIPIIMAGGFLILAWIYSIILATKTKGKLHTLALLTSIPPINFYFLVLLFWLFFVYGKKDGYSKYDTASSFYTNNASNDYSQQNMYNQSNYSNDTNDINSYSSSNTPQTNEPREINNPPRSGNQERPVSQKQNMPSGFKDLF